MRFYPLNRRFIHWIGLIHWITYPPFVQSAPVKCIYCYQRKSQRVICIYQILLNTSFIQKYINKTREHIYCELFVYFCTAVMNLIMDICFVKYFRSYVKMRCAKGLNFILIQNWKEQTGYGKSGWSHFIGQHALDYRNN